MQALRRCGGAPFLSDIAAALPPGEDPAALVASMAIDGIDSAAAGLAAALAVLLHAEKEGLHASDVEGRFEEALRLAMPVLLSMRQASADTVVAGIRVAVGTVVWTWWAPAASIPRPIPSRSPSVRAAPGRLRRSSAAAPMAVSGTRWSGRPPGPSCVTRGLAPRSAPEPAQAWRLARLPRIGVRFER